MLSLDVKTGLSVSMSPNSFCPANEAFWPLVRQRNLRKKFPAVCNRKPKVLLILTPLNLLIQCQEIYRFALHAKDWVEHAQRDVIVPETDRCLSRICSIQSIDCMQNIDIDVWLATADLGHVRRVRRVLRQLEVAIHSISASLGIGLRSKQINVNTGKGLEL